jgi:hypothetical protein
MAKSQRERTRDYLARTRRKAQAFDKLMIELNIIKDLMVKERGQPRGYSMFDAAIERAAKAIEEPQE